MNTAIDTGAAPANNGDEFEARVAARTEELSALSTYLLRMMESERSQLAKELHDELGGLITAAKMDMAWLHAHIGSLLGAGRGGKIPSLGPRPQQGPGLKRRGGGSPRPA